MNSLNRRVLLVVLCMVGALGCGASEESRPEASEGAPAAAPATGSPSQSQQIDLPEGSPADQQPSGRTTEAPRRAEADEKQSAAEEPVGLAGDWLVATALPGTIGYFWLLRIEEGTEGYMGELIDAYDQIGAAELTHFEADDTRVNFTLSLRGEALGGAQWNFEGRVAEGRVRGTFLVGNRLAAAWLERTQSEEVPDQPLENAPGLEQLLDADVDQLRRFIEEHSGESVVFGAYRTLLRRAGISGLSEEEVREMAQQYAFAAEAWGPRWHLDVLANVAYDLTLVEAFPAVALDFARQAHAGLRENTPPSLDQFVRLALGIALLSNDLSDEALKVLEPLHEQWPNEPAVSFHYARSLEATGRIDEAIEQYATLYNRPEASQALARVWQEKYGTLDGMEEKLDEVYRQHVPPFEPETFAGRTAEAADQVTLMELFTGAQCGPCMAADAAFDALSETYKPSEVVLLQYHLHIPGPDPMTNPEGQYRSEYYQVQATPTSFLNGRPVAPGGGGMQHAQLKYQQYREHIDPLLEEAAPAHVELSAAAQEDRILIKVGVREIDELGEHLRLRLALVEETVRYVGANGIRLHHAVVRAMPGGPEGIPVTEAPFEHQEEVSLSEVRSQLQEYLQQLEGLNNFQFDAKPLELEKLGVAAFLQDDQTQEILQAAFVPVPRL